MRWLDLEDKDRTQREYVRVPRNAIAVVSISGATVGPYTLDFGGAQC